MTGAVGLRAGGLGLVTLLVTAIAVAATLPTAGTAKRAIVLGASRWYTAVAAPAPAAGTRKTACGVRIRAATLGIGHPVLPCGVRLELEVGGRRVIARVVDRGPHAPGREFDVTHALAARLGLHGARTIHWRFAG